MNKFLNTLKKPYFGQFTYFYKKASPDTHNFIWVSSTMPRFRKKIKTQFHECLNRRKDRRKGKRADEKTDKTYFIAPF